MCPNLHMYSVHMYKGYKITRQQNVEFTAHVSRVALSYAIFSREKNGLLVIPMYKS